MKKVLITGASGFFGKSIISALKNRRNDSEYFCISRSVEKKDWCNRVNWIRCDLLNFAETSNIIKEIKPTHCIHLAWYVSPEKFWNAKENYDWLYASIHLFDRFCEEGGKVFIGAGTIAEYDWGNGFIDELSTKLKPSSLYGQCKKSLYEILKKLKETRYPDVRLIWPRIGYFFGLHEPKEKLISKLIYHITNQTPIDLASPEFKRPYSHVKYAADGFLNLLFNEKSVDFSFNMSSSVSYPLKKIVQFIAEELKIKTQNVRYNMYPSNPVTLSIRNEIFKKIIGVNFEHTFLSDLRSMIKDSYYLNIR